jgi:hypothetical protein
VEAALEVAPAQQVRTKVSRAGRTTRFRACLVQRS